jgi:hypothetical protein
MKDWLLHGAIETDVKMAADLAGPGYHINRSNLLVLESKADMQKRGQASPDDGDALALTFAQPVAPAEKKRTRRRHSGATPAVATRGGCADATWRVLDHQWPPWSRWPWMSNGRPPAPTCRELLPWTAFPGSDPRSIGQPLQWNARFPSTGRLGTPTAEWRIGGRGRKEFVTFSASDTIGALDAAAHIHPRKINAGGNDEDCP